MNIYNYYRMDSDNELTIIGKVYADDWRSAVRHLMDSYPERGIMMDINKESDDKDTRHYELISLDLVVDS